MIVCSTCDEELDESCFSFRPGRGKYRTVCRKCMNFRQRENYYKRKKVNPFVFKHQKLSNSAKQRDLPYDLTPEFLKGIWTGICPVSGEEIFISLSHEDRKNLSAAELDRFVPELGYVRGNVTWISRRFNMKKQDSTLKELKSLVEWMERHEPVKEAHADIEKAKNTPWNKGLKMEDL